jgi:NAD(P)-dependent dehydrogenase (short-subunit alcohol dehydrogenase family)
MVAVPDLTDRSLDELVSLRGRNAVVTGGAKGLGRAIARRLAEAGASVVIGDVDEAGAKAAAHDLANTYGGAAEFRGLDVTDPDSVAAMGEAAVSRFGSIDIWVNNAGVYPATPIVDMAVDEWDHVLAVNLRGTFLGCREAARRMVPAGRGGVIVNLASVAGISGRGPGVAHYVASKHGVVGITRQLAVELAPEGIRVLGIAPTIIITPGVEAAMSRPGRGVSGDLEEALRRPLGRAGRPDDVARVVLFCASDLSSFMSGSTLVVDAGEMAR